MNRLLAISIIFSMTMVLARIAYTGKTTFIFMNWNLFLAFIPYCVSQWFINQPAWIESKWKSAMVFIVWLLFIPNSFYILTDLYHLHKSLRVPLWYDLLLLLSFAWNGLLLGVLSVRHMEKVAEITFGYKHEIFFIYPIMWLNALGVYVGRYLRFNTWDILTNPFKLIADSVMVMFHEDVYKHAWGMVFVFSIFLTLLYLAVKKMSKALL